MAERYVTLLRYQNPDQAIAFQDLLENAGIQVIVTDQRQTEAQPDEPLPDVGNEVLLQVPESQAKEAGDILEESFDHERFD